MKSLKLFAWMVPMALVGASLVYAMAPAGGYAPNATLDPDCAPGDVDCFVATTTALTEPWFGTDDDAEASDNTEDIYSLGNVGIGTSTVGYELSVDGQGYFTEQVGVGFAPAAANELRIGDIDGDDITKIGLNSGAGGNSVLTSGLIGGAQITSLGSGTLPQALTILNSNGNVGVGTTTPATKLHVEGTGIVSGHMSVGTTTAPTPGMMLVDGRTIVKAQAPFAGWSLVVRSHDELADTSMYTYNGGEFGIRTEGRTIDSIRIKSGGEEVELGSISATQPTSLDVHGAIQARALPSGADAATAGVGTPAGAVCIDTTGSMYIDTDTTVLCD